MKVKIEAVARDLKKTQKEKKDYSGIKLSDGRWVNIIGDFRGMAGKYINITEPHTIGAGKQLWAFEEKGDDQKPQPEKGKEEEAPQENPILKPSKDIGVWAEFVRKAWAVASELEPDDPQARAAIVNTAVIAWGRGDIFFEIEDTEEEVPF